MIRCAVTLSLLLLGACTVPGQHLPGKSWVYAKPEAVEQDYELVRLSPEVLQQLRLGPRHARKPNPELERAIESFEYRVGPNDILSFTVWDHPELTIPAGEFRSPEIQGHLVSPQGEIFFPYVGNLQVSGHTLGEIRARVSARLARYIQNPQLDVRVAAFRSQRVNVSGRVARPGFFALTDVPMTLVEVLNLAGGPTAEAALQSVRLTRQGTSYEFDVLSLLESGDLSQNVLLVNGDLVYVPENSFYSVHVLGSVRQPGALPIASGRLNLAEVISRSGGLDSDVAHAGRIFVFRYREDVPTVYWLDASSPDAMLLATQFPMQPQDVAFVSATRAARYNRVVSLMLPTVQTLWQTRSLIDDLTD